MSIVGAVDGDSYPALSPPCLTLVLALQPWKSFTSCHLRVGSVQHGAGTGKSPKKAYNPAENWEETAKICGEERCLIWIVRNEKELLPGGEVGRRRTARTKLEGPAVWGSRVTWFGWNGRLGWGDGWGHVGKGPLPSTARTMDLILAF